MTDTQAGTHEPDGPIAESARRVRIGAIIGVVVVLGMSNLMSNRILPAVLYVPWNVLVAVVMVMVVHHAGLSWAELGFSRRTLGRSLRWGLLAFGGIVLLYAVALAIPATRVAFEDGRAGDATVAMMLYQVLLRIPLGTVLLEEVAFRGTLPALFGRREGERWRWFPVLGSSVLFGLWHALPALTVATSNEAVGEVLGGQPLLTALAAVGATTVAGIVLCWWRHMGRGLLTPIMSHIATNSLGYAVAWVLMHG